MNKEKLYHLIIRTNKLNNHQKLILMNILSYMNKNNPKPYRPLRSLTKDLRMNRNIVIREKKKLVQMGILIIQKSINNDRGSISGKDFYLIDFNLLNTSLRGTQKDTTSRGTQRDTKKRKRNETEETEEKLNSFSSVSCKEEETVSSESVSSSITAGWKTEASQPVLDYFVGSDLESVLKDLAGYREEWWWDEWNNGYQILRSLYDINTVIREIKRRPMLCSRDFFSLNWLVSRCRTATQFTNFEFMNQFNGYSDFNEKGKQVNDLPEEFYETVRRANRIREASIVNRNDINKLLIKLDEN